MSTRWKIIIGISLALNLFLIGSLVGVAVIGFKTFGEQAEMRRGRGGPMSAAFQALPEDRRQAFREVMRAQALSAAPDFKAAGEARREAMRLMSAEPYDATAVSAALDRARIAEGLGRARIDATLAARLGEFSPEERRLFAQVMMRGPGGRGRRGGPGGRRGDGPPPPPPPGVAAPEAK